MFRSGIKIAKLVRRTNCEINYNNQEYNIPQYMQTELSQPREGRRQLQTSLNSGAARSKQMYAATVSNVRCELKTKQRRTVRTAEQTGGAALTNYDCGAGMGPGVMK